MAYIRFNPSALDQDLFQDRDNDKQRVREQLQGFLEDFRSNPADLSSRTAFAVYGDKGIGKSMLVGNVIRDLRREWSSSTLFLSVDCRNLESVRAVIQKVALAIQEELSSLADSECALPDGLKATADLLVEVTRYDVTEFQNVQSTMSRFLAALSLKGSTQLLRFLDSSFGISLERETKVSSSLSGKVTFDVQRLATMLKRFFVDIRESGFAVVLCLDNIDELRHEYATPQQRATVRDEAKWVLDLHEAPVALVACMRTYFATGIMPREITLPVLLNALPAEELMKVLDARLARERPETLAKLGMPSIRTQFEELSTIAYTPLAFLTWCKWIAAADSEQNWRQHAMQWYRANYTNLDASALNQLRSLFGNAERDAATRRVSGSELLKAVGNELRFEQLRECQAVLPVDFWNPVEFTIDPTLVWVLS